jgi:hypothetical protein
VGFARDAYHSPGGVAKPLAAPPPMQRMRARRRYMV